jgi:hypothetical protein
MELIEQFKYLPSELINIILNYTNIIVYRNGKYINRIKKNFDRDNLLKTIHRPIYIGRYGILLRLMNCNMIGYFVEYNIQKNITKLNIQFFHRVIYGYEKYFDIKSNETYIFDMNNKWSKIINYLM